MDIGTKLALYTLSILYTFVVYTSVKQKMYTLLASRQKVKNAVKNAESRAVTGV